MEDIRRRMDDLIMEIRELNKEREERGEEMRRLKAKTMDLNEQIEKQRRDIEELCARVLKQKKQLEDKEKRIKSNERAVRNECRRKELFNSRFLGSSKTQREYYMSMEMKVLSERCEIMQRFIAVLSEEFCFDSEVLDKMLEIADGFDDPIITTFLKNITCSKENRGKLDGSVQ